MSSANPRPVTEINLEEFERRLRASAAPQANVEDPLAELTRLVDTIGVERTASERALETQRALRAKPKPELRLAPPAEAPAAAPPPPPPAPRQIEPPPLLLVDAEPPLRPSFDAEDLDSSALAPPEPAMSAPAETFRVETAAPPARRTRNWGLKVGGLIAAAALMAGTVIVFKVGGRSIAGAPPLILASTAPTKVPPPSEATIRTANESGNLLTHDTAQPTPTPPKLVNAPEAPVDLSARPLPSGATPIAPAATETASASADASPVAPSSDTPVVAATAASPPPASPAGADPSRVKTISVRPDGTLISSGYEDANATASIAPASPPATMPAAPSPRLSDADAEASSPAVALPTKLSPPKSSARVVAKTDTTAPADSGSGPVPTTPKPKKVKPAPAAVAEAEPKTDDADAAAPEAASGGFAVQLAAPKSEGEAKALIKRLSGKFADALGSTPLGVRKAERHGEDIYRVRAGGLSHADAAAMCAKIKSAGGDCYVAKN